MNINQQIDFLAASANPFPLQASFEEMEGGGYKCKLCGEKVKDQNACTDHLLAKHREMESYGTSEGVQKSWDTRGRSYNMAHSFTGDTAAVGNALMRNGYKRTSAGKGSTIGQGIDRFSHPDGYKATVNQGFRVTMTAPLGHHNGVREAMGLRPLNEKSANSIEQNRLKWRGRMEARDFSEERRKSLAKSGKALPGGGFPIGRAKNPTAARRHINERAKALGAKPIGAQTEFQPDMRLRMPKKAGQGTTTQNPQYTGGQPELRAKGKKSCCAACAEADRLEALGMHRAATAKRSGCGSHGFALHKGASYAKKAASMGHRISLAAAAERPVLIRQRASNRRKVGYSFRGYQGGF